MPGKDVFGCWLLGKWHYFFCLFYFCCFVNLPATLKKSIAGWNCQKNKIIFFCCPVLEASSLLFLFMLFRMTVFSLVMCCALLHEAELAFSGFALSISLLYKSNFVFYFVLCVVCVLFIVYAFCSVLFWMLELLGKSGEASGGGYLLRGMEQAGKLFFWFCF